MLFAMKSMLIFLSALPVRYVLSYPEGYSPEEPFFYGIFSLCIFASGSFIYVSKVPERLFPGKFDCLGASH
jgi:hypothetical protein